MMKCAYMRLWRCPPALVVAYPMSGLPHAAGVSQCWLGCFGETEFICFRVSLHKTHEPIPLLRALHDNDPLNHTRFAVGERRSHLCRLDDALAVIEVHPCRLAQRFG